MTEKQKKNGEKTKHSIKTYRKITKTELFPVRNNAVDAYTFLSMLLCSRFRVGEMKANICRKCVSVRALMEYP